MVTATPHTDKKNPDNYWSTENAPIFYGATKITIPKGLVESFNPLDARFRIFAKDFEDGDLTPYITCTHNVEPNTAGTYHIAYTVKDSNDNEVNLQVPVIVLDDTTESIKVERTLYTIPSRFIS